MLSMSLGKRYLSQHLGCFAVGGLGGSLRRMGVQRVEPAPPTADTPKRACGVCGLSYASANVFEATCCRLPCCVFCLRAAAERHTVGLGHTPVRVKLQLQSFEYLEENGVVELAELFPAPAAARGAVGCPGCHAPCLTLRCPARPSSRRSSASSASSCSTAVTVTTSPEPHTPPRLAGGKGRRVAPGAAAVPTVDGSPPPRTGSACALGLLFHRLLC
eukprot:TRINITY_DN785_c0_g3_i1.p2 TRINITY_DN785_c0_g3~~TRINITY_DN785_c0_g3_i1.p2  ORF type:complete len:217 (+),score=23.86 TRINITY_DN785_c0_g3_i1:1562-2212(+)